jgi:cytochrome c biogenesis protein CcmG/thiol:disulfide interchange protein DsbE
MVSVTSTSRAVALVETLSALVVACSPASPPNGGPPAIEDQPEVNGLADVDPCPRPAPENADSPGDRLPDLELPCLGPGAATVNLDRLGGQPVLVNLWATWCGPCREEMPTLQQAYQRHRDEILLIGIDTRDDPATAADFLDRLDVSYPQLYDAEGVLLDQLRIPGLPVTVALAADGAVVSRHVGPVDEETIESLINQVADSP